MILRRARCALIHGALKDKNRPCREPISTSSNVATGATTSRPRGSGLEQRVAEHNAGTYDGYTATRRRVKLIFSEWFDQITDAIAAEQQVKGWSRAKKEASMRGDFGRLQELSKRRR